ncbi:MAG: sulfotransferase family 2 domain-containing protein [Henriciella sp.]
MPRTTTSSQTMIINNTHKFIFVHVPKSAGTSVSLALSQLSAWNDIEIGGSELGESIQFHYSRRYGLNKHSPASKIKTVVGDEVWSSYFTFAYFRNPIDRVHSLWSFLNKWKKHPSYDKISAMKDVDEFILSDVFRAGGPSRICKPQMFFLDETVDFIGSLDRIERDFAKVLETIGIPQAAAPKIEHANASRSQKSPLSDEAMKRLRSLWAADFAYHKTLSEAAGTGQ